MVRAALALLASTDGVASCSVYGDEMHVEPRTVDVHVRRLRKRMSEMTQTRSSSHVRGVGYKFSPDALGS